MIIKALEETASALRVSNVLEGQERSEKGQTGVPVQPALSPGGHVTHPPQDCGPQCGACRVAVGTGSCLDGPAPARGQHPPAASASSRDQP